MPVHKTQAEESLDRVIKEAVAAPLKPLGFKKRGRSFYRRINGVVQAVQVQVSQGSTHSEKTFYVNLKLAFDAICSLTNLPIIETPPVHVCDNRGTGGRLKEFYPAAPPHWSISTLHDADLAIANLRSIIDQAAGDFEQIASVADYRRHRWFDRFRPRQENAQMLYLLGESDAAWSEVMQLCKLFADRMNANQPQFWINELGLSNLQSRVTHVQ